MRRRLLPLVALAILAVATNVHACGRCGDTLFHLDMQRLERALLAYHLDHGCFPVDAADSTWVDALVASGLMPLDRFTAVTVHETDAGTVLHDPYDFPLVVEMVKTETGPAIIVRSVGANGIDEQGANDDWDLRYGANWGHWYKRGYPAAVRRAGIAAVFIAILFVALRPRRELCAWVLSATLFLSVIVITTTANPLNMGAALRPWWLADLSLGGAVGMFTWFCAAAVRVLSLIVAAARRAADAKEDEPVGCRTCGYSREGAVSECCPECGARWDEFGADLPAQTEPV